MRLLSLQSNFVFKAYYTRDPELLVFAANSILKFPDDEQIVSLEILNPDLPMDFKNRKSVSLDIKARD